MNHGRDRRARSRMPLGRIALGVLAGWACAGAAAAQTLTKLPMLQTWRTSEAWLQWETDSDPLPGAHFVDWGLDDVGENTVASSQTVAVDGSHFVHRAVLSGLAPDTPYRYRVRSGAVASPEFGLRTARGATAPFTAAWIADNQNQLGMSFANILARIAPRGVDFIGHAGDTIQNQIIPEWNHFWYQPFRSVGDLGQEVPVLVARGNHDGEGAAAYAYHWLPNGGSWYAQTIGRTRLLVLDSNLNNATQTAWLAAELASPASRRADFRIAVFHHLPFTNLWCDSNGFNGSPWVRANWVPLFEQHGVDLVINGHAHAYERGERNGVMYTVVGGAGGLLDTFTPPEPWEFLEVALSVHHYAVMEVNGPHLTWTAYDPDDQVIDQFELFSASPVPALTPGQLAGLGLLLGLLAGLCPARRSAPDPRDE